MRLHLKISNTGVYDARMCLIFINRHTDKEPPKLQEEQNEQQMFITHTRNNLVPIETEELPSQDPKQLLF